MYRSKDLLAVMGKRRTGKSHQKRSENSTETHLLEHGFGVGESIKGDEMPNLLIESIPSFFTLTEAVGADGKKRTIARGEFGRCGVPTQNGRNYPEKLMQRELDRLSEDLSNRRILGELDHPTDGKTSLKRVSHVITGLKIRDGIVIGEAEILNTPEGQTLKALIEAKVQIGVSSRGYGSTRPGASTEEGEIVQDDFVLKTYDFVADPAVKSAIPKIFSEDIDVDQDPAEMFLNEFPEVAQAIKAKALEEAKSEEAGKSRDELRKEMSEAFEKQLAEAIVEVREELKAELTEQYESDPDIGAAKAVLSAVAEMVGVYRDTPDEKALRDAMKATDLAVAEAKEEAEVAREDALQAECIAFIEREISGNPMAETVRSLMKRQRFDSVEDAKERLKSILNDLPDRSDEDFVSEEEAALREDNAELQGQVSLLEERVAALADKLKKAVDVGMKADTELTDVRSRVEEAEEEAKSAKERADLAEDKLKLQTYKYEKVAGLTNGRKLLSLLEDVSSKDAVDRLVSDKGIQGISDPELRSMRERLQRGSGERQEITEEMQKRSSKPVPGMDGIDDDTLRLAGITE